jgi:uncharacterized membrane protein YdjX (TVP38/TMEM64 family)
MKAAPMHKRRNWITDMPKRGIIAGALLITVVFRLIFAALAPATPAMMSAEWAHDTVVGLGVAGPLALVGLMIHAIVVSPIPSGPIAVAAGALYGMLWGGVLAIAGVALGALIAFGTTRYLGFDAIRRSDNSVLEYIARPRSQFALMLIVFASRLVPFISFDADSYAAGLTCLSFGRFALATLLGIAPICFALAAMGAGMVECGTDWMLVVTMGGAITLLPILGKWVWDRVKAQDWP